MKQRKKLQTWYIGIVLRIFNSPTKVKNRKKTLVRFIIRGAAQKNEEKTDTLKHDWEYKPKVFDEIKDQQKMFRTSSPRSAVDSVLDF